MYKRQVEGNAVVPGVAKTDAVEPWVAVGGSWRDEDNVCGYWRFSEGADVGHLKGEQKVTGVPKNINEEYVGAFFFFF